MDEKVFERFIEKVDISGDCWEWTGGLYIAGYGQFYLKEYCPSGKVGAHIASFLIFKGDIKRGEFVCHTCDNRLCVNPEHLFLGSQRDNMQDMHKKGRGRKLYSSGAESRLAKLTQEQAREIRREYNPRKVTYAFLAKKYGVCYNTIVNVIKGFRYVE